MLPTKSSVLGRTREAGLLDISTTTTTNNGKIKSQTGNKESDNGQGFKRNESPRQIQKHKMQEDLEDEKRLSISSSEAENKKNSRNDLNSSTYLSKSVDKLNSENNPFLARSLSFSSVNTKKEKIR